MKFSKLFTAISNADNIFLVITDENPRHLSDTTLKCAKSIYYSVNFVHFRFKHLQNFVIILETMLCETEYYLPPLLMAVLHLQLLSIINLTDGCLGMLN
jgi:hypothetical protein